MQQWFGYLLVICSAVLYGSSSIVIKYTYQTGLMPIAVMLYQNLISLCFLWAFILFKQEKVVIPPQLRVALLAQGAFGGFLTTTLYFQAIHYLGAALATVLLFTYPAFVTLYQIGTKERAVSVVQLTALGCTLVGIVCSTNMFPFSLQQVAITAIGMGVAAAMSNAFISINGERIVGALPAPVMIACQMTVSTAMMLLVYRPLWLLEAALTPQQVMLLFGGAAITLIPFTIYCTALRYIGAGVASMLSTLEIPIALVLAWVFLREAMNQVQIIGGMLILASVAMLYYQRLGQSQSEDV